MSDTAVRTPTLRQWWRRGRYWVGAAALLTVVALVSIAMQGTRSAGSPLDPANPAPIGAKAIAEVLRQQGVEVLVVERHEDALAAAGTDATLLIDDWRVVLEGPRLESLAAAGASRTVLVDPTAAALDAFLPGVRRAGVAEEAAEAADCAPLAGLGGITGYSSLFEADSTAGASCYPMPSGLARIVIGERVTVLGASGLLSNERIVEEANAAVALRLLGTEPRLVWYRPGLADADAAQPPTIAELSPPWVVPAIALLVAAFLAAAVWRGRRMGPLLVESLPSIVPADESVRGRARLHARAGARLRAADALRLGTLDRLAHELRLPAGASVDAIAAAAAARTDRPVAELLRLLRDEEPADDRALLRIATELERLERAVTGARRPTEAGE